MRRVDSPYVTPKRAAVIAGLLDADERDPETIASAVKQLKLRVRAWNRRKGRPFAVRAVYQGRTLESVDGEAVRRMQDVRADEVSGEPIERKRHPRRAKASTSVLRTLTDEQLRECGVRRAV